jgi:hypothetical protein
MWKFYGVSRNPEDRNRVIGTWNAGELTHLEGPVCWRRFYRKFDACSFLHLSGKVSSVMLLS